MESTRQSLFIGGPKHERQWPYTAVPVIGEWADEARTRYLKATTAWDEPLEIAEGTTTSEVEATLRKLRATEIDALERITGHGKARLWWFIDQ